MTTEKKNSVKFRVVRDEGRRVNGEPVLDFLVSYPQGLRFVPEFARHGQEKIFEGARRTAVELAAAIGNTGVINVRGKLVATFGDYSYELRRVRVQEARELLRQNLKARQEAEKEAPKTGE